MAPVWRSGSACLCVQVVVVALLAVSAADAQTTVLFLDSQPGDFVGGGRRQTFTPLDGAFTANSNFGGGVSVAFVGLPHFWHLDFAPVQGTALVPGAYDGAQRFPFQSPSAPGLDVFGDGAGCNTLTGRFVVHELIANASGTVLKFAADFEQHCEGALPALFGSIRINSNVSLTPRLAVGDIRLLEGDSGFTDAAFSVFLTRPTTATVTVEYSSVDGTAVAGTDYFSVAGTLTFEPGQVEQAVRAIAIANAAPGPDREFTLDLANASGAEVAFASAKALVIDDDAGRSFLYLDSQAFDSIGRGVRKTLDELDGTISGSLEGGTAALQLAGLETWSLHFAAPSGAELVPGTYEDAERWPFQPPTVPGLDVSGEGSGCNMLVGRFVVHEIEANEAGELTRFAADFEQHCEGSSSALFGSLRLNSTVPASQQTPLVGDWNGDGWTDLLWRHASSGVIGALLQQGIVPLTFSLLPRVADPDWEIVGTGDWNGDGKTDLLWRHRVAGENVIQFLDGVTVTGYSALPAVQDPDWRVVSTGRFDEDGWPDILWRNQATGDNGVWFMMGATLANVELLEAEPDLDWAVVGAGDWNRDGRADILWRNRATGANGFWLSGGPFLTAARVPLLDVPDTGWQVVAVGDFNRDGQADIVWRHRTSGLDAVWFMDGTRRTGLAALQRVAGSDWTIVGPR